MRYFEKTRKKFINCNMCGVIRFIKTLTLLIILIITNFNGFSYNLRQTSSEDGLSNSAILSLCTDSNGFLWIGTCDGVNIADGTSISTFQSFFPGRSLSGNIIEKMLNGSNNDMWVLTNYGLDLVETTSWEVRTFPQFHGQELLCSDPDGRLYVLSEDSRIYVFNPQESKEFIELGNIYRNFNDIRCITFREGELWVVAADGISVYDVAGQIRNPNKNLIPVKEYRNIPSIFAKSLNEDLFVITFEGELCEIEKDGNPRKITNIYTALSERGGISDLVNDHNGNFFVSFSTDGVIRIGLDGNKTYTVNDLGLQVGVFCLESSEGQDIVWIGSDCQGIYTFWDDKFSIRSYDFNNFNNKISHPVRAVYLDQFRNMWLGTKGDGLLKITDFNEQNPRPKLGEGYLYTSSNSTLCHNSVFAFGKSSRPILWIATEDGLNYFNYSDKKLYKLKTNPQVKYIHGVYEENDSTLWMCTLGMGIIKAQITVRSGFPELTNLKFYTLDNGKRSSNQFFSFTTDENGKLLFCNRGKGMFEIRDERLVPIPIKNDFGSNAVTDVFAAIKENDVLWIGTGQGLIKSWPKGEQHFLGIEDGFANNTIHDMLFADSAIWVSTNDGIVRFNLDEDKGETFGRNYGLNVTEYSDGAGFNTGETLIFGGINGLTFINQQSSFSAVQPYVPDLIFIKLSIAGENIPVVDYLDSENGKNKLVLDPDQNYFTITISAPDFINAHNYVYSYTLDGVNWINNGSDRSISFNGMRHGTYNLEVKYLNLATGIESEPYSLKITIKAPWYLSGWAQFVYFILGLALLGFIGLIYMKRLKQRRNEEISRLEQLHKEEVYEEKLRFFTNITHEFCTPLTLIYGPCERILDYPGSDDYIKKYVSIIRSNAERLNTLIQELIDFRRIETGNKNLKISQVGISELCKDIITSFSELADRNNITFVDEIETDIVWSTDFECVRKILTNLISNAFKYTPTGGTIKINVRKEDDKLRLAIYNTGQGISEEGKKKIFNRYSVLDNVEENAVKGLSSRNGLGLAICHSMVDMLQGNISINSEVGKYAEFIVILPQFTPQEEKLMDVNSTNTLTSTSALSDENDLELKGNIKISSGNPSKERILVVDDNNEILLLLRDVLSDYDVVVADNVEQAIELIRNTSPDLIVSDIMMPGTDGMTFTRMLRQNKHTMHIPLILLSAKTSNEEKVEGIESGADAYIGKPFNIGYFQAVVKRLLENRQYLREYYNTAASAYEYTEGKLLHREDKDFLANLISYIEENIEDSELNPEKLATHMKISVRNLYRKFKELDQLSPNDFIKYQRISYAAKLLVTTSATVQEIIYRSGFTNRSHFYKEFDKRFGMTPKDYRTANAAKDVLLDGEEKK